MYTMKVPKKQQKAMPKQTDLGRAMKRWREEKRLNQTQAAERIDVVKSTWSQIEKGERHASMDTLMALVPLLGRTLDELAAMDEQPIRLSHSQDDRNRRIAAMTERNSRSGALVDLLPELTDREIDTLLSVGENLIRQRGEQR
jgi:transcriptional regulator with XRE-family HTH domain